MRLMDQIQGTFFLLLNYLPVLLNGKQFKGIYPKLNTIITKSYTTRM